MKSFKVNVSHVLGRRSCQNLFLDYCQRVSKHVTSRVFYSNVTFLMCQTWQMFCGGSYLINGKYLWQWLRNAGKSSQFMIWLLNTNHKREHYGYAMDSLIDIIESGGKTNSYTAASDVKDVNCDDYGSAIQSDWLKLRCIQTFNVC